MEEKAIFTSDGLKLQAVLHRPQGPGSRPAFMVLHGFGGNKDGGGTIASCRLLEKLGYAALRFDFRGCGESEGPRGRTICLEQVADVRNALTWLATQPGIDPARIGEFLRRPTLMFNGYADQVASLYSGMDLRRNY